MIKKYRIIIDLIPIFSVIISAFFGIVSWKASNEPIGTYFSLFLFGLSLILIFCGMILYSRISEIEVVIYNRVKSDEMTGSVEPLKIVDSYFNEAKTFIGYLDYDTFQFLFKQTSVKNKIDKNEYRLFLSTPPLDTVEGLSLTYFPLTFIMNALFFDDSELNITSRAILIPHGSYSNPNLWIYINKGNIANSINNIFKQHYDVYMINLQNAYDLEWVVNHSHDLSEKLNNKLKDLASLNIKTNTPSELYEEQVQLSKDAEYIHAFDMTDIDEWFDESGLGACLKHNIESAKKPDGTSKVRRIFLFKSRRDLNNHPDLKKKLAKVIKIHFDNGVGCGLVFREEIKRKEYIKDFVVYDKKVVWVETQSTDKYSGAGYFSTDKKTVRNYLNIFNNVWNNNDYQIPEIPEKEAKKLLKI